MRLAAMDFTKHVTVCIESHLRQLEEWPGHFAVPLESRPRLVCGLQCGA